jgi:hypothetical protein
MLVSELNHSSVLQNTILNICGRQRAHGDTMRQIKIEKQI